MPEILRPENATGRNCAPVHSPNSEIELQSLLDKIYLEKRWDFRNYKLASVRRRINKRLQANKLCTYADYSRLLDADPMEYKRLFSTLTIKVSEFYREPEVFDYLRYILTNFQFFSGGLKAWSCGCAHGEEAYSLAMLLSESMAPEALAATKIYATDIDNDALEAARKGEYKEEFLVNISPELMEKYFIMQENGSYKVDFSLRKLIKFGSQDIVKDSAISKIDILFCRNLFIYFNKTLQERVFEKLDFALKPGGVLVLGKAEVVPQAFISKYMQVGGRMSIYRKRG